MRGRPAYVLQVRRPHAFLARRRAPVRDVAAQKLLLELVHAGAREKERRVVLRHERVARDYLVGLGAEKFQKQPSYLVSLHNPSWGHSRGHPTRSHPARCGVAPCGMSTRLSRSLYVWYRRRSRGAAKNRTTVSSPSAGPAS